MENTIGTKLQQLIKEHEQTNAKAAEAIGVSASLISDIINGKKKQGIGADIVKKICEHYHVSSDWLLGIAPVSDERKDFETAERVTGLSEEAIKILRQLNEMNDYETAVDNGWLRITIDTLIKHKHILQAMHDYLDETPWWEDGDSMLQIHETTIDNDRDLVYNPHTPAQKEMINAMNMSRLHIALVNLHNDISSTFHQLHEDHFNKMTREFRIIEKARERELEIMSQTPEPRKEEDSVN